MTKPKRPTHRTIVAGVPNRIGEMKFKCRQPARCKRCCVRGWPASGSNCRNVDYRAVGEGVAEIAILKSKIYETGNTMGLCDHNACSAANRHGARHNRPNPCDMPNY